MKWHFGLNNSWVWHKFFFKNAEKVEENVHQQLQCQRDEDCVGTEQVWGVTEAVESSNRAFIVCRSCPAGGSVHPVSDWQLWPHCSSRLGARVRWTPKNSVSASEGTGNELYAGLSKEIKKTMFGGGVCRRERGDGDEGGQEEEEGTFLSSPLSSHSFIQTAHSAGLPPHEATTHCPEAERDLQCVCVCVCVCFVT